MFYNRNFKKPTKSKMSSQQFLRSWQGCIKGLSCFSKPFFIIYVKCPKVDGTQNISENIIIWICMNRALPERCQRGHNYNTMAEPLLDISFVNMNPVVEMSSTDSGQKLVNNIVFLFKTFISAKPTVWEWNIWVVVYEWKIMFSN